MARYIDADKAIFELGIEDWEIDCKYFIEEQPTADVVEVVHGEWGILTDEYDCEYVKCSTCNEEFYPVDEDTFDRLYNYCPNCGTKMDGKKVE